MTLTEGPKRVLGEHWTPLTLTEGPKRVLGEHMEPLVLTERLPAGPGPMTFPEAEACFRDVTE